MEQLLDGPNAMLQRDRLDEARPAVADVMPELVKLVREIPDTRARAVGTWNVGEVAAHLSHVIAGDTDCIAGRPFPEIVVSKANVDELTAQFLADDPERDPATLAERIDQLARDFEGVTARCEATTVTWLGGAQLTPSAVACHLLEECLVHGHDIARATGRPWPIRREHALLALEGAAFPIIGALPTAFVKREEARSLDARVELRLRGGARWHLVIDHGVQRVEPADGRGVDAHLSADPAALLLVLLGRVAPSKAFTRGKALVWGRRPWKLARMLGATRGP